METESNGKRIGLIVLITVLVLAVLGLGGYIIYDKVLKYGDDISVDNDIEDEDDDATRSDIEIDSKDDNDELEPKDDSDSQEKEDKRSSNRKDKSNKDESQDFSEYDELTQLNKDLEEIYYMLGWIALTSNPYNDDGWSKNIKKGVDLLSDEVTRQLFIMEYILADYDNYDKFLVFDGFTNTLLEPDEASPTSDYTFAFLDYNDFNDFYKLFFDTDFDRNLAQSLEPPYSKGLYVYYDNKRPGNNGIFAESMTATEFTYSSDTDTYEATLTVKYLEGAAEALGYDTDTATLIYKRGEDNHIILVSFIVE